MAHDPRCWIQSSEQSSRQDFGQSDDRALLSFSVPERDPNGVLQYVPLNQSMDGPMDRSMIGPMDRWIDGQDAIFILSSE